MNMIKDQLNSNVKAISAVYNATKDVHLIANMQTEIELYFSQIEQMVLAFERTAFKFRSQRLNLQMGQMNEELLPPDELEKMRNDFPNYKMPTALWIYAYCKLSFFRQTGDNLVFQTIIPILGNFEFETYSIFSFPFVCLDLIVPYLP